MLPSGLSEEIADEEDLARFLTQSSHFNATMAKAAAFLPQKEEQETSVSRHGREPLEGLWSLGLQAAGGRKLYGAAIFKASAVRTAQLQVRADEPPPRHASVHGWPQAAGYPELQKAKQKESALILASAAGEPVLRDAVPM